MSRNTRSGNARMIVIISALLLLAACSSVHHTDQEGGISGTGHDTNCELQKNKNHPQCIKP